MSVRIASSTVLSDFSTSYGCSYLEISLMAGQVCQKELDDGQSDMRTANQ
jgi:hypothetical protein